MRKKCFFFTCINLPNLHFWGVPASFSGRIGKNLGKQLSISPYRHFTNLKNRRSFFTAWLAAVPQAHKPLVFGVQEFPNGLEKPAAGYGFPDWA